MISYEYYYLFGVDIPLEKYGLGTIKQPKLYDFIKNGISIEEFYMPFLINDFIVGQVENKDDVLKLKESLGSLRFLLNTYKSRNRDMSDLKTSLRLLYNTNDIFINTYEATINIGKELINNNNFDILCDIVLEMLKINKSIFKFDEKKKTMSEIEMEFERRRLEYEDRIKHKKKEKGLTMLDIANVVAHSHVYKYDDVLNMTIYQIKSSYEAINLKESYETETLYRISPKFEIKKDKSEHWTEKIKLDKSTLSR